MTAPWMPRKTAFSMPCCHRPAVLRGRQQAGSEKLNPPAVSQETARRRARRQGNRDRADIPPAGVEIMAPPGMEEMTQQLQNMFSNMSNERRRSRKMKVADALVRVREEEAAKLVNEEEIKQKASRLWSRTALSLSTKSTRWPSAPSTPPPTYPGKACSGTCCR